MMKFISKLSTMACSLFALISYAIGSFPLSVDIYFPNVVSSRVFRKGYKLDFLQTCGAFQNWHRKLRW